MAAQTLETIPEETVAPAQKPLTNSATNTTEQSSTTTTSTEQSSINTNTVFVILGVGGFILSTLGVYYQREAIIRTLGRSQPSESNTTTVDVVEPPPPKLKEKCGIMKMK